MTRDDGMCAPAHDDACSDRQPAPDRGPTDDTARTTDWRTLPAGGALNCLVAERVLGYHVERVTPEWYQREGQPPREVLLFFRPGHALVTYSWDAWSCNACMYRNGEDDSDGTAPPLPSYSDEPEAAWLVVEAMREQGWSFSLALNGAARSQNIAKFYRAQHGLGRSLLDVEAYPGHTAVADTPALAICRAALAAVEVRDAR